jgi:hypothetical protein
MGCGIRREMSCGIGYDMGYTLLTVSFAEKSDSILLKFYFLALRYLNIDKYIYFEGTNFNSLKVSRKYN